MTKCIVVTFILIVSQNGTTDISDFSSCPYFGTIYVAKKRHKTKILQFSPKEKLHWALHIGKIKE